MVTEQITVTLPRDTVATLRQMSAAQGIGIREYIAARLMRSAEVFTELMDEERDDDDPPE